jgi:hypothetical protein
MWFWYSNHQICYAYLNNFLRNADAAENDVVLSRSYGLEEDERLKKRLVPYRLVLHHDACKNIGTEDKLANNIRKITNISRH